MSDKFEWEIKTHLLCYATVFSENRAV